MTNHKPVTQWLEISIQANGELAEAIADVFSRFTKGVAMESLSIEVDPEGEGKPSDEMRVYAFLPMDDAVEETRQKIEEALWHLNFIQPIPKPQYRPITEQNWMEAWKKHYRPIVIGERLIIVPPWVDYQPKNRITISIEPGLAFGTGTHPTTQLSLNALEKLIQEEQSFLDVIDVGCGSGILTIAAIKLGAGRGFGVDIDADAIENAQKNARLNGVEDKIRFAQGSINAIRAGIFEINQAPIVVANIIAPILKKLLLEGLSELVLPGGVLVLSGILEDQLEEIREALLYNHFIIREQIQMNDWIALIAAQ